MAPEVFKRQRGMESDQVLHCYQQATEPDQGLTPTALWLICLLSVIRRNQLYL
jgi:hypothetical protein